jgi:hypothetical protein
VTLHPIMEVDHVTYIFGSFSRRRQAEDVAVPKRRSLDPSPAVSQQRRTGRYELTDTVVSYCFFVCFMTLSQLHGLDRIRNGRMTVDE